MESDVGIPEIRNTIYVIQARSRLGTEWLNEGYAKSVDDARKDRNFLAEFNSSHVWRIVRRVTVTTQDVID